MRCKILLVIQNSFCRAKWKSWFSHWFIDIWLIWLSYITQSHFALNWFSYIWIVKVMHLRSRKRKLYRLRIPIIFNHFYQTSMFLSRINLNIALLILNEFHVFHRIFGRYRVIFISWLQFLLILLVLIWYSFLSPSWSNTVIIKRFRFLFSIIIRYTSIRFILQNWWVYRVINFLNFDIIVLVALRLLL